LPSGSQWLHEIKHDGFRIIARKTGAQVRLYSRPGNDLTRRFPSLSPRLVDDRGEPYPFVTYYLNDEDIRFGGGFQATVTDGDELIIVSAVAGG